MHLVYIVHNNLVKFKKYDTISNLKCGRNLFRIFKRNRISQLRVFKRTQKRSLQWGGKVYLKGCAAGKQPLGSIYLNSHRDNGAVVCRLWRSFSSFVGNCWFSNCDSLIPGGFVGHGGEGVAAWRRRFELLTPNHRPHILVYTRSIDTRSPLFVSSRPQVCFYSILKGELLFRDPRTTL